MKTIKLLTFYYRAYECVIDAGYEKDIAWCDQIRFEKITIDAFFREYVWTVLNAGMREQAARKIYEKYMETTDTDVIKHDGK